MVSYPKDVEIDRKEDDMGTLFTVKVHKDDFGKVLGRDGRIAEALRIIARSAGRLSDLRACLKIEAGTSYQLPREKR
jgi:predicted RNA-binding protein YlqC (UPF0109 family)